ncbi:MAG: 3-oxoacyl-[acyl-carrier-protein] reductase [Alphaproteobacteria bacterium]|nr:3-oxoacyl-[acyl-carrier-protein] reductase [Alphaproteobacteria bacterium]
MFDLSDRTALVTGASGGIGAAIARALAAQGARVGLSGTREAALEALAGELDGAAVLPCNLGDSEAADGLVARAEEALGPLDILVSNAGVTRDGLFLRMRDEDWQTVLDINLTAGFRLARSALRGMMRRRRGRIIAVSSVVGVTGNPGQANYAASKAGMIGMTKAVAAEVAGRGVTVNCIAPGFIDTAMTQDLSEKQRADALIRAPAGRFGLPEDVAAAAVFLASDEAAYVTGQTLHVNGGMAMI